MLRRRIPRPTGPRRDPLGVGAPVDDPVAQGADHRCLDVPTVVNDDADTAHGQLSTPAGAASRTSWVGGAVP